ncbi:MAG: DNA mismatch repair endonuclease MutL [Lachnospiraceae bacterium]|nr:DNA mismatch repair endonuclease MutL [Lachnospiraceae bacterium]
MTKIQLLDSETIDKIAAGEVVERPASVVKELVENAVDAGATAVTVEIKEGGISFIRVTDNGEGIASDQVQDAFLRHATSKIKEAVDLNHIQSLGFRGEALSSIAAVAQVEMMTRRKEELMGVHYCIEGGKEISFSEAGVPEGTTILVKNLFFHTPARRKFLKTPATEGGYIADLCERLALSKPAVAFRFIANGQVKFHTSGNGDMKEIIYRIFGRDFLKNLVPVEASTEGFSISGYLGKPVLNRSNRNFENCFVNGRYVKSALLYKAVEEGYRPYLMQHKFPFVVLHLSFDSELVDVNVHPTKMDIRLTDSIRFMEFLSHTVGQALKEKELIPDMEQLETIKNTTPVPQPVERSHVPEPFEEKRMEEYRVRESMQYGEEERKELFFTPQETRLEGLDSVSSGSQAEEQEKATKAVVNRSEKLSGIHTQMNLFEDRILREENRCRFEILGQAFDTYWILRYEDKLLFVDQHSAHEKVKYERLMAEYQKGEILSQNLQPPMIFHLTQKEEAALEEYRSHFEKLGFVWEDFGSHSIAMRAMPVELYGKNEKTFFEEILDELVENGCKGTPEVILEKIISMSCKAAVKGNQAMDRREMQALVEQMLTLENPYHCPHGRPTMISMSKQDLEKKFKRIV